MAIVVGTQSRSQLLPVGVSIAGLLISVLALALIPALHPITVRTPRYVYVLILERWEPPEANELYPYPELRFGPWRYRLVYWPQMGVR